MNRSEFKAITCERDGKCASHDLYALILVGGWRKNIKPITTWYFRHVTSLHDYLKAALFKLFGILRAKRHILTLPWFKMNTTLGNHDEDTREECRNDGS